MKHVYLASIFVLVGCSFGGFKPPKPYYSWSLHNEDILYPDSDPQVLQKYLARRKKDMLACRMNYYIGESDDPKVNLCMESKGWYLKGGPVCEEKLMWRRPLCIQWREKHSKADVKPWGCKKNPSYPTCVQTGSQRE
ncbi:hypothetical protein [Rodentibacter caecimuris]|uniref:hypothetical protein n=1 Tax=Rodentibacter caecimuris TaxID=1796644 RepID=UPI0009848BCE|nr:hypothetical protein BKG97_10185 [Rodentibacter heylii]